MSVEHTLLSTHATHVPVAIWQNGVSAKPGAVVVGLARSNAAAAEQNGAFGDLQSVALTHLATSTGLGGSHSSQRDQR